MAVKLLFTQRDSPDEPFSPNVSRLAERFGPETWWRKSDVTIATRQQQTRVDGKRNAGVSSSGALCAGWI